MAKVKLGFYQHYKGDTYEVIGVARHSETLEELVIYQGGYYHPEFGNQPIFARPLKIFLEKVELDGKLIPRFKHLEE